jgi:putative component of membrane protein insertase Oxa1/YidC/SpoIIIJ protein YidD
MHGAPPSSSTRLALWAIRLYQRHLSPIKGFSCAWRATTRRDSCSAYGYRVIARHGLMLGWPLLRRQLRRCGQAHARVLAAPHPLLHHQRGECDIGCCDLMECGCDLGDLWDRKRWRRWRERRQSEAFERRQRERAERLQRRSRDD